MLRRSAAFRWIVGLFICPMMILSACLPLLPAQPAGRAGTQTPTFAPTPTALTTPTPAPTFPIPEEFKQAPQMERQVMTGDLPRVRERLPKAPKVIKPVSQIGKYGGDWRMVIQPGVDQELFLRTVAYEPLVRWTADWSGVEPNLVEHFEVNQNATEYSFTLRKGVRWSDGVEFSTDDIRFWYEDVLLNKELTLTPPFWLRSGSEIAKFEFIDRYTFKVSFNASSSLFLPRLATPEALILTSMPAHYAKKYHRAYLEDAELNLLLKGNGFESWVDMFLKKVGVASMDRANFIDPARPRLTAWVLKTPYEPHVKSVVWERNPFYWKVDTEGNQLPYIDRVIYTVTNSLDDVVNRVIAGAVDMQNLSALGSIFSPELVNHSRDDFYRFVPLQDGYNNVMVIHLNLNHEDPVKRQIFQSKEFRIALSYGINREEIINTLYKGQGTPWQAAPRQDSLFYDKEMADQHTRYDLKEASRLLDAAGLKVDSLGKRLGSDGKPISFTILVQDRDPDQIAILNLIARDWAQLGLDVQPQVMERPIFLGTVYSNLHDAVVARGGSTFFYDVLLNPSDYMPYGENSYWAIRWATWSNRTPGQGGIQRPSLSAATQMERFDLIRSVTNTNEQLRLMKLVLTFNKINFWNIGVALGPQRYVLVRRNFYNVPMTMPSASTYPDPAPTNPEQYFISAE